MNTVRDAEVELSWLRHRIGEELEVDAGSDLVAEVRRVIRERDDARAKLAAQAAKGNA